MWSLSLIVKQVDIGATKKGPIRSKMGPIRSKNGEKGPKWGLFWVLPFIKIPLISPSLDQKEQNCFGHPQFYSSIAPMRVCVI